MTMTLEQVRDWHLARAREQRNIGCSVGVENHKGMADAVDAHIAGMGEPVAWLTEDGRAISAKQKSGAIRDGGASASSVAPYGLPAYPAPSIDLAAVREVIAHLRSFRSNTPPTWAHLDDAADKLEAAIKGGA